MDPRTNRTVNGGPAWGDPSFIPNAQGGAQEGLNVLLSILAPMLTPDGMQLGQFQPNQNIADTQEAREFRSAQIGARQQVGQAGQRDLTQIMQGAQRMGLFGGWSNQQVGNVTGMVGAALPWIGMFGGQGLLQGLGPGYGAMDHAGNMANMLRPDMQQLGGPKGLQQRAAGLSMGVYDQLYANDPTRKGTRGIDQGTMGALTQAAALRGIGPKGIGNLPMDQASKELANWTMRAAKPMSAIRDIQEFNGLSADQQWGALDALTMGKMNRQSFEASEQDARQFKALTRSSMVTTGEGMALQQIAGARSQQLGGRRDAGATAGAQAMAFGAATNQLGADAMINADTSKAALMQKDSMLRAQAVNSTAGEQMAALMRMGESGMLKHGPGKEAFEALKKGDYKYMEEADFTKMMSRSGVSAQASMMIRNQRDINLRKYGDQITENAREQQWDLDVGRNTGVQIAGQLGAGRHGMKQGMALKLGKEIADTIREQGGKSDEDAQAAIVAKLKQHGIRGDRAQEIAISSLGAAESTAKQMGYSSWGEAAILHGKGMHAATRKETARAKDQAKDATEHAHEGQLSPMERGINAVKAGVRGLGEFLGRLSGGFRPEDAAASTPGATATAAGITAATVAGAGTAGMGGLGAAAMGAAVAAAAGASGGAADPAADPAKADPAKADPAKAAAEPPKPALGPGRRRPVGKRADHPAHPAHPARAGRPRPGQHPRDEEAAEAAAPPDDAAAAGPAGTQPADRPKVDNGAQNKKQSDQASNRPIPVVIVNPVQLADSDVAGSQHFGSTGNGAMTAGGGVA